MSRLGSIVVAPIWDATTFTKNRDRLLEGDIAQAFLGAVLSIPRVTRLGSSEHFSVDGTLIEAWSSMKSFKPKEAAKGTPRAEHGDDDTKTPPDAPPPSRNGEVDFHGEKRSNATHASTSDPDARLYRKGRGREAKLCYLGHALMENRNKLIVRRLRDADQWFGGAQRRPRHDRGLRRPSEQDHARRRQGVRHTGLCQRAAIDELTPHVTQNFSGRRSAIDGRVTRHAGDAVSLRIRKRIEEAFGWGKEIGTMRRTRFKGLARVGLSFSLTAAAYNLVRLPKFLAT